MENGNFNIWCNYRMNSESTESYKNKYDQKPSILFFLVNYYKYNSSSQIGK